MPDLHIAADRHIPIPDWMVPKGVRIQRFDPSGGFPADVTDMDALLVRTVLPVHSSTLPQTGKLRFVGSATAGYDHVDTDWLRENGVSFACSRGCNARSVAEYVATVLLLQYGECEDSLRNRTVGIIGAGYAGRATAHLLEKLGMRPVLHDPPREAVDPEFQGATRADVLQCEILSFHTSYHRGGSHPSHHWMDENAFQTSRAQLLINASRGGVVDEEALGNALKSGPLKRAVLDVWEGEPMITERQVEQACIATPHIAGYSVESKENASRMVIEALCREFNRPVPSRNEPRTPIRIGCDTNDPDNPPESIQKVIGHIHPVLDFDREMRRLLPLPDSDRNAAFLKLRAEAPLRREFPAIRVPASWIDRWSWLSILGIEPE
ncbi:MAG: 4-phosphoerythronate dehydrogenase [Balneolaceae bacterium]